MEYGFLSQYFAAVAAKKLSAVETDPATSNQHEFNGAKALQAIFGLEKRKFQTQFIYLCDDDDEPVKDTGFLTWYHARLNHATRKPEARMYFSSNAVMACASAGDNLFVALRPDDTILAVVAESGSTISHQLQWLFGLESGNRFDVRHELENDLVAFSSRFIIEQLGITIEFPEDNHLEEMLSRFGGVFPSTRVFSAYAQETLPNVDARDTPDVVLMQWMEQEERLFRMLEKHLIETRLRDGFDDVDSFLHFSLSVQNRRKSRAGQALENHVEALLKARSIQYARTAVTENRSKPDFMFPGSNEYHDINFDVRLLTMLGVKSTCKDRWRQVLSEAERIQHKHLLTLEPSISKNQTDEMQARQLQLVLPEQIHGTYTQAQQQWLMPVHAFLEHVQFNQRAMMQ